MKFPYTCKIPPCPIMAREDLEKWLTVQAQKGLYLQFILDGMVILKRGAPSSRCFLRVPASSKDLSYNGGKLVRYYFGMLRYRVFYHRENVPPQKEDPYPRLSLMILLAVGVLSPALLLFALLRGSSYQVHAEWLLGYNAACIMVAFWYILLLIPQEIRALIPKFRWPAWVEYVRKGFYVLLAVSFAALIVRDTVSPREVTHAAFYESGASVPASYRTVLGGFQTDWREDCPGTDSPWDEDYVYVSQFDFAASWMAKSFYHHFCRDMGNMEPISDAPDGMQCAWTETELLTGGYGICLVLQRGSTAIYVNNSGSESVESVFDTVVANILQGRCAQPE